MSADPVTMVRPSAARERILDTAFTLFYARGIRGVGVDLIIAESGVAKATFYKHFPSKDDLVVAYLDKVDGVWSGQLKDAAEAAGADPASQLVGMFDALSNACRRDGLPRLRLHQRRRRIAARDRCPRPHRRPQDGRAGLGARPRRAGRRARPWIARQVADPAPRRRAGQRLTRRRPGGACRGKGFGSSTRRCSTHLTDLCRAA